MLAIRQLERLLKPTVCQYVSEVSYCCEKREFRHPGTHTFERMKPLNLVGKGKYPKIKPRHYVYKKLEPQPVNFSKTMLCVLTKEIVGTGLEGQVVEVSKVWFRNELYPLGLAVYASPENVEKYEEVRKKSRDYGIDYKKKMTMLEISKMHVNVYMNTDTDWILDENHMRIAMRKLGIILDNENIILDKEPKSTFGPFTFWVQLQKVYCTKLHGTVHPLGGEFIAETTDDSVMEESTELRDDKQPVLFYEDVFGSKEALSPNNLAFINDKKNSEVENEDSDKKT